jgi:hypothetical protein
MKKECNTCSLEGTSFVEFCSIWLFKQSESDYQCSYYHECQQVNESITLNMNNIFTPKAVYDIR